MKPCVEPTEIDAENPFFVATQTKRVGATLFTAVVHCSIYMQRDDGTIT
jgi:hypothetical protein